MKRVIAVVFAAMLFATVLTAQEARAEGLLSDFFNMIKKWFESSPLGNIFSMPVKRIEEIKLVFYPESFVLNVNDFVNLSTNTSEISNFKGSIEIDMRNNLLVMKEEGSSLSVKERLGVINIKDLKIGSLDIKETKLALISGNWNETTENGSIVITDFLGNALVREGSVELEGNVSKILKE
jgi:hypothetical protein